MINITCTHMPLLLCTFLCQFFCACLVSKLRVWAVAKVGMHSEYVKKNKRNVFLPSALSLVTRPSTRRGGSGTKCQPLAGPRNGRFREHFGWCRSPAWVKLKSKSKGNFLKVIIAADPSFRDAVVDGRPCLSPLHMPAHDVLASAFYT
jgi:hypothetical protein